MASENMKREKRIGYNYAILVGYIMYTVSKRANDLVWYVAFVALLHFCSRFDKSIGLYSQVILH